VSQIVKVYGSLDMLQVAFSWLA